jgi:hypothetical protein
MAPQVRRGHADQEHGPTTQASHGLDTLLVKGARRADRRSAQREHQRRWAGIKELRHLGRQLGRPLIADEARDLSMRWPVRLGIGQQTGEESESEPGRELPLIEGVGPRRQTELGPQLANGLCPTSRHPLPHANEPPADAWSQSAQPCQP